MEGGKEDGGRREEGREEGSEEGREEGGRKEGREDGGKRGRREEWKYFEGSTYIRKWVGSGLNIVI